MNILPKKRWHVRTKENIARVRKDEAEAAEKERQEKLRIENADREARLNILKQKSKQRLLEYDIQPAKVKEVSTISEHINFFSDLEHANQSTNKDHDQEVKEKKEEYEKKIGYLTYLGQDTNEALGKKNWYDVAPDSSRFFRSSEIKDTYDKLVLKDEDGKPRNKVKDEKDGEIAWKAKQHLDPINTFKKYCHSKSQRTDIKYKDKIGNSLGNKNINDKKYTHKKTDKNDSNTKLQKLREARLKREQEEKYKTKIFLSKISGTVTDESMTDKGDQSSKVKPKYHSQFNPELARQNYR